MASRYKETFDEMIRIHKAEFEMFKKIHDIYQKDQTKKDKFDEVGKYIVKICQEYENKLCRKMEGGSKGMYSSNVADKFREEIRKTYPLIDLVGVTIT